MSAGELKGGVEFVEEGGEEAEADGFAAEFGESFGEPGGLDATAAVADDGVDLVDFDFFVFEVEGPAGEL